MWEVALELTDAGRLTCLGFLIWVSVLDIRYRKIPDWLLVLGGILVTAYCVLSGDVSIEICLAGLLAGMAFLLVSKFTNEALGYGDSWILCIAGAYLGIWKLMEVLVMTWILLSFSAMMCLIWKKWSRKAALPMVPFLTAGYVIMVIGEQVLKYMS